MIKAKNIDKLLIKKENIFMRDFKRVKLEFTLEELYELAVMLDGTVSLLEFNMRDANAMSYYYLEKQKQQLDSLIKNIDEQVGEYLEK